ncbi:universal stress protein [Sulfurimonas sp.]|uniref:universal stress protein n=1 Tax=Sulfurimonas sp. TaxID=2022749 RepID=UPI002639084A|nr:universal stress protein [Sulfurimonas sp.]MCW8894846.1 universal stress protein [Sulfurimonas sp.]MCW9067693.1 universal stress protein [Sulfurimonas sp.]
MENFSEIVVGLDISNNAKEVLSRAFLLAKRNDSNVTIAHAIDIGFFGNFIKDEKIEKLKTSAIKGIKKLLNGVDTQGLSYSIEVQKAKPSVFIMNIAKDRDACMIVIGANEKKNFTTSVLGSTAHNIAQKSHLPLHLVKNNSSEAYKNIVAFTDLSEVSKKSILFSKEFFHQGSIKCVYAYKLMSDTDFALKYNNDADNEVRVEIEKMIQTQEQKKFDKFAKENNISDAELIEDRVGVTNALTNYVNTNGNDLVVLGSSGVNNTGALLYGSTASSLMQSLKCDVLVYVPKE